MPKEKRRGKIEKLETRKIAKLDEKRMIMRWDWQAEWKITSVYLCWKLSLSLFSLSRVDVTAVLIIGNWQMSKDMF